jgi:tRNA(Ile)-lysidine synthase
MQNFVRNLITEWRRLKLPFEGETAVVAISGGADSVSVLLGLYDLVQREKLKLRLVAAHFNHHLRGEESDKDEEFVRNLTAGRRIELAVGHARIEKEGNLEQNARAARYEFLERVAANTHAFAVITGHTMNDQAETFLINLIRGSGIEGLGGMKPVREIAAENWRRDVTDASNITDEVNRVEIADPPLLPFSASPLLVRPLLSWAQRMDTEAFCRGMAVDYCCDTMNEDTAFRRVRIRKVLIPLLQDFNPKIIERLAATAQNLQGLVDEPKPAIGELLQTPQSSVSRLSVTELKAMETGELRRHLRQWVKRERGDLRSLGMKHIEGIERLVNSRKSGNTVELPGGDRIIKEKGGLVFRKIKVEKTVSDN